MMNSLECLSAEYQKWLSDNGLPDICAMDLQCADIQLSSDQRAYLKDFSARWDAAEDREAK